MLKNYCLLEAIYSCGKLMKQRRMMLLNQYEPGLSVTKLDAVFDELKRGSWPYVIA